jgi:outer membrane cobalamin receptor
MRVKLKTTTFRRRLFASSLICGAAALASAAYAAPEATEIQAVVVTGSRIPQPNLTSISPVSVMTNADIKAQGATRVEDLVNTLPQAFASQGSTISNGASGTATVNLRGLGASRTLVLIDGRRLVPGDPGTSAADLNFIPGTLVDRIDVLTGGASAVYGADAVGGVVNFVMIKDFQGVKIDAQWDTYQHDNGNAMGTIVKKRGFALPSSQVSDGKGYEVSAIIGVNAPDGKGNVTAYATYRQINAILQANRDFSSCTLSETGTTYACGGSSTSYPGRFSGYSLDSAGKLVYTKNDDGTLKLNKETGLPIPVATSYSITGGGGIRPYSSATDAYNFGPLNYFQRPDERYTLGAFAHYQIHPKADAYTQIMFADDHSVAQIAPGGIFYGTQTVNCDNPLLSAAQISTLCIGPGYDAKANTVDLNIGRRNVEGGGRQSDIRHTSYRILIGLKGDLDNTWNYDAYAQYGTSILQSSSLNYFLNSRIARALIVKKDPKDGVIKCQSVIDGSDPACVPYNLWSIGGVTKEALNYLQAPSFAKGTATEKVAAINFAGKLGNYGIKSPWAEDGVGIALGAEYREEGSTSAADFLASSGDLSGAGGASPPVSGHYNVYDLYGEAHVPLISNQPFIKALEIEGAYRYSDYSSVGTTDTFKIGGDWSINNDVRLRASFNRAVRAPNINDLYTPQNVVLDGSTDPCSGAAVNGYVNGAWDGSKGTKPTASNGYTAAQCARTGVTAAQFGTVDISTASQYNGMTGGNPKLKPETSDTVSLGAVFTPSAIRGLTFSIDYFDIKVEDYIGGVGADTIIASCLDSNQLCSQIRRDKQGSLWINSDGYVVDTTLNTGSLQTSGADINAQYRFSLETVGLKDMGRLSLNFVGTYLNELVTEPLPGAPKYDCAGLYGVKCGAPSPTWRHKLRATWDTPWSGVSLSAQWRYIGDVDLESTSNFKTLAGTVYAQEAHWGAYNYIDLGATWRLKDEYTLRVGVNNVFDKDPPIVGQGFCPSGQCNGNTFPQVYDSLGRYFFAQITAQF